MVLKGLEVRRELGLIVREGSGFALLREVIQAIGKEEASQARPRDASSALSPSHRRPRIQTNCDKD